MITAHSSFAMHEVLKHRNVSLPQATMGLLPTVKLRGPFLFKIKSLNHSCSRRICVVMQRYSTVNGSFLIVF